MKEQETCSRKMKDCTTWKKKKTEAFKVHHARTERYKKSPIIYMQQILNEHYATHSK